MAADEGFLKRWSRRKSEDRGSGWTAESPAHDEESSSPAQAPAHGAMPAGAANPAAHPEPALPDLESLRGLESDYEGFLRPGVDENLRRDALKKLFHDPHFNVMDGLDVYIDDYSRPDPIPAAMLAGLAHARSLLSARDEEPAADGDAPEKRPAEEAAEPEAAAQPDQPQSS